MNISRFGRMLSMYAAVTGVLYVVLNYGLPAMSGVVSMQTGAPVSYPQISIVYVSAYTLLMFMLLFTVARIKQHRSEQGERE